MLIRYCFKAGATREDMSKDMAKLLSNADISTLSNSCDKSLTLVVENSIPSNWEYWDASGSYAVIRSLNADGLTYKYALLQAAVDSDASATVAYNTSVTAYESWNKTTHVGVNPSIRYGTSLASPCGRYSTGSTPMGSPTGPTSASGVIYMYATSRCAVIDGVYVGEFIPDTPILDGSYPRVVVFPVEEAASIWATLGSATAPYLNSSVGVCRWMGRTADMCALASGMPSVQLADLATYVTGDLTTTASGEYRKPDNTIRLCAFPAYVRVYIDSSSSKNFIGRVCDIWYSGGGYAPGISPQVMDEVIADNGDTYIYLGYTFGYAWVKKG